MQTVTAKSSGPVQGFTCETGREDMLYLMRGARYELLGLDVCLCGDPRAHEAACIAHHGREYWVCGLHFVGFSYGE